MEQIYCSVNEIVEDLGQTGLSESAILSKIVAASQNILRDLGQFLPVKASKSLPSWEFCLGDDESLLVCPPLLSITSVTVLGTLREAGDYRGWPTNRCWPKGPYSALQMNNYDGTLGEWAEIAGQNVIAGLWGMYDEALSLGISVSQLLADTTLVVTDGSLISPGMVVKIEDEWELVTSTGAASASTATLNGALDDSAEEITVSDGTKVKIGETLKVDFELMKVLDVAGNVVLAARGINGSKRASHLTGVAVNVFRTFNVTRAANGSAAAAHTTAAISRQVVPADVNYLCRQIAALMIKKAQTGYVGRAGNDEMGTGFFVNEFPKNQVEAVKKNYFWGGV